MQEEALPGFRVEQVLGSGPSGELWRAREEATGEVVVLQRLHAPAALSRAQEWAALGSAYVVAAREVLEHDSGPVLVLEPPVVEPLAALLRRRGRLTPGEVVTVGVPVAQALAVAHAAGLVHGALSSSSVLLTPSGMPLLGDPGTGVGTPVQDVRALAELCRQLLGAARPLGAPDGSAQLPDDVPEELAALLEQALAQPPPAGELAQRLGRAHPAAPLRLSGGRPELGPPLPGSRDWAAPAPRHGSRRARRQRPGVVSALVLVALCLGVVAVGAALRSAPDPVVTAADPGIADPAPAAGSEDWAALVQQLDLRRERAWAAADPGLLAAVYVPGSRPARADEAALDRLRRQGRTAEGVRHRVVRAQPRSVTPERVELRVVDVLAPQQVRDDRGRLVERRPGRGERAYDAVLLRTAQGWRLAEVSSLLRGSRAGPARGRRG